MHLKIWSFRSKPNGSRFLRRASIFSMTQFERMIRCNMKTKLTPLLLLSIALTISMVAGRCADAPASAEADLRKDVNSRLHFQTGEVTLPGSLAKLNLPEAFRYLPPSDAEFVLTKLWGNPPGHETLGMIFPSATS